MLCCPYQMRHWLGKQSTIKGNFKDSWFLNSLKIAAFIYFFYWGKKKKHNSLVHGSAKDTVCLADKVQGMQLLKIIFPTTAQQRSGNPVLSFQRWLSEGSGESSWGISETTEMFGENSACCDWLGDKLAAEMGDTLSMSYRRKDQYRSLFRSWWKKKKRKVDCIKRRKRRRKRKQRKRKGRTRRRGRKRGGRGIEGRSRGREGRERGQGRKGGESNEIKGILL